MKMVTAIIRTTSLEGVIKSLGKIGVKGITISEIKGIGEQIQLNKPYLIHNRIEIIIPDDKVNDATNTILEHAHTGMAGDGLIAVFPIEGMLKIKTRERVE